MPTPDTCSACSPQRTRSSPSCSAPAGRRLTGSSQTQPPHGGSKAIRVARGRTERPESRLLSPAGPIDDGPATLVDAGALYAGETVARIAAVKPAAELVRA